MNKIKSLLFVFFFTISISLIAQDKYIIDLAKIDSSTKLIGRYPQYDKQKTYQELNFIIDDPETIKQVITTLTLGKEGKNILQNVGFTVSVVQNYREVKNWIINPSLNSVLTGGHTYEFDVNKLKELAKKYPFDYRFDKITFKNKADYIQYLEKQKKDKTYLFDYAPQFKYEGSFEIQFPRDSKFSSPKAINDYLNPILEKIVSKNEYRIGYIANQKNRDDQSQFTMTINGSKKLFDELSLENLKQKNWIETVEEGLFFYRIK